MVKGVSSQDSGGKVLEESERGGAVRCGVGDVRVCSCFCGCGQGLSVPAGLGRIQVHGDFGFACLLNPPPTAAGSAPGSALCEV